jgi:hypothetical protein
MSAGWPRWREGNAALRLMGDAESPNYSTLMMKYCHYELHSTLRRFYAG